MTEAKKIFNLIAEHSAKDPISKLEIAIKCKLQQDVVNRLIDQMSVDRLISMLSLNKNHKVTVMVWPHPDRTTDEQNTILSRYPPQERCRRIGRTKGENNANRGSNNQRKAHRQNETTNRREITYAKH